MLKTAKQVAQDNGKIERLAIVAIQRLGIEPDRTMPHAGRIAKYYGEVAQKKIATYFALSRQEKVRSNPFAKPRKGVPRPRVVPRSKWTYSYLGKQMGGTWQGARTILALHGYSTIEAFIASNLDLEDVKSWYSSLPGDSSRKKGRELIRLGREAGLCTTTSREKIIAAQARIIANHDPVMWATRAQAAEFLGYNDTSTYQLYKNAGFRFLKDHAVRLYNWEDLKTLKASLLQKRKNLSSLAAVMKVRLLQEGFEFTEEKTFSELAHKRPLRFDYCIPSMHVLIEVQGPQHFSSGYQGFASSMSLEDIQARDTLKREFANSHGWDLLWVTALDDVSDVIAYLKASPIGDSNCWPKELVEDYGRAALDHYDGLAPRFCWLHRGHFPFYRAGMELKRIHKSYWSSAPSGAKSPKDTWATRKSVFQRLVVNRQKYHPSLDISDPFKSLPSLSMLVAGFGVAKISPPASFFSPSLGRELIQRFAVGQFIVDPFSGFSGRMLAAVQEGKAYRGFDISPVRVTEAQEVISFYKMQDASVKQADVSSAPFAEWGEGATLLTCPPYGDKESWDGVVGYEDEDYWIGQALKRHGCARYIFVVGATERYKQYLVPCNFKRQHSFYTRGSRQVVVIDRADRDQLVCIRGGD